MNTLLSLEVKSVLDRLHSQAEAHDDAIIQQVADATIGILQEAADSGSKA